MGTSFNHGPTKEHAKMAFLKKEIINGFPCTKFGGHFHTLPFVVRLRKIYIHVCEGAGLRGSLVHDSLPLKLRAPSIFYTLILVREYLGRIVSLNDVN